jgi:Bacterial Ig-like domain
LTGGFVLVSMGIVKRLLPLLILLSCPFAVLAQSPYDDAVRVSVDDLLLRPSAYNDRLVWVTAELNTGDFTDTQNRIYELRGQSGLERVRVGQRAGSMNNLSFLVGRKVEIRGIFWDLSLMAVNQGVRDYPGALRQDTGGGMGVSPYFIGVLEVNPVKEEAPTEESSEEPKKTSEFRDPDLPASSEVDLRELMVHPDPYYDQLVSVIGKFRGDNVYGDLPMRTKKTPRDFIIKVADVAIWVTGRTPRGEGFELNPERRRDTGKWLRVIGVPWTEDGVVYLRARKIELVPKPEDPALEPKSEEEEVKEVKAEQPPPDIIFSMPLEGEKGVALDTEFRIQFSQDMNRASFDRNVDLLYADDEGEGNPFPGLQISYDPASRSLMVSPGKPLLPGKEVHLIFYQGIRDTDDRPLVVHPEASEVSGAAAILVFFTAAN